MKLLVVSDLHGRKEACYEAIQKFKSEQYDKIIFLGDYLDSFVRSNEDMFDILQMITNLKIYYRGKVVLLLGNHDMQYMYHPDYRCSGFRPDASAAFSVILRESRSLFQVAHEEEGEKKKYLFSHAGVQKKWFEKYKLIMVEHGYKGIKDLCPTLNNMLVTGLGRNALCEVGVRRGGMRYDYGGPVWCDKTEMESYGPIPGYIQIIGHTPVKYIERVEKFEGDKKYNNTAVIFTDVLKDDDTDYKFLTLEI